MLSTRHPTTLPASQGIFTAECSGQAVVSRLSFPSEASLIAGYIPDASCNSQVAAQNKHRAPDAARIKCLQRLRTIKEKV
jgi:hypothetical protein